MTSAVSLGDLQLAILQALAAREATWSGQMSLPSAPDVQTAAVSRPGDVSQITGGSRNARLRVQIERLQEQIHKLEQPSEAD